MILTHYVLFSVDARLLCRLPPLDATTPATARATLFPTVSSIPSAARRQSPSRTQ